MERPGHKLEYHMKDASGKLATIVQASQKDNAAVNDAFTRPPLRSQNGQAYGDGTQLHDDRRCYTEGERQDQYEQQQKAMRHWEEEIARRKEESRRRKEEDEGIVRRQKEAEEAARAARSDYRTTLDNSGARVSVLSAQDSLHPSRLGHLWLL
jgi:membrane protein involved in colicin uptake